MRASDGIAILLAAVLVVSRATAQNASAHDSLLMLPMSGNPLMCRASLTDSGWVTLQFVEMTQGGMTREFQIGFDSAASPVFVAVAIREPGRIIKNRGFVTQFRGTAQGVWAAQEEDPAPRAGPDSIARGHPLNQEAMGDSDIARARALAVELWGRRCMKRE